MSEAIWTTEKLRAAHDAYWWAVGENDANGARTAIGNQVGELMALAERLDVDLRLLRPLVDLLSALQDISNGTRHPLAERPRKGKGGQRKPSMDTLLEGDLSAVVTRLMDDGLKEEPALREVARALDRAHIALTPPTVEKAKQEEQTKTWKTLQGLRDKVMSGATQGKAASHARYTQVLAMITTQQPHLGPRGQAERFLAQIVKRHRKKLPRDPLRE